MNKLTGRVLFVLWLFSILAAACSPGPTLMPEPMVLIPAGAFKMGDTVDHLMAVCVKMRSDCQPDWFADEVPSQSVDLPAFYMDVYEVTNGHYRLCAVAGKCTVPLFTKSATRPDYYSNPAYENYPVVYVSWNMAEAYCQWRGARLPTEAEWEKAARGTDGRIFPWGDSIDKTRANYTDAKNGDTTAVGSYESGKSPYGMYDMAGNVWEWTSSLYKPFPYNASDGREDLLNTTDPRVMMGGSWNFADQGVRSGNRSGLIPAGIYMDIGFRCAKSAP